MSGGAPVPTKTEEKILSVADLEEAGSRRLEVGVRDFFNSGSTQQTTLHSNTASLLSYRLRPRILIPVSNVSTSTYCFTRPIAFPVSISPAGLQGMAHPTGELATSRACAARGVDMAISSLSNYDIAAVRKAGEEVGEIAHAVQMYTMKDRALQERILRRAEEAECVAVFLTADSPVLGVRYNEWRNDLRTPEGLGWPVLELTSEVIRSQSHDGGFVAFNHDGHSWAREIPWLRSKTKMQIWVKGVLTAEDAVLAVEWGCDGIVVSNHGGRQLDGVPATIDVLAECVDAVAGRIPVHVDGGFRTGKDIFVAMALGAQCVWLGRPAIWGLAYDGQAGVDRMLEILQDEFKRCMQLTGCRTVKDITKASIARMDPTGVLRRVL